MENFAHNVANDEIHKVELEEMGYKVIVLGECEINEYFEETMAKVLIALEDNAQLQKKTGDCKVRMKNETQR